MTAIAGVLFLAIPIILGALMLMVGLKGIGRMLGVAPTSELQFFCGRGRCTHEIDEHRQDRPIGQRSCKRCPCIGYLSQLHLDWMAQLEREYPHPRH